LAHIHFFSVADRVFQESKKHSEEELRRLESEGVETAGDAANSNKNEGNVIG